MREIISRRASMVTPVPLGSETTVAQVIGDTVITVIDSGDYDETGTVIAPDGNIYTYVAMEDGEEDDDPDPSITLEAPGLLANLPAGSRVEEYDPANEALIIDYMVQVTDDADGSTNEAYLHHTMIPMLPAGLPPGVGDSVEVTIDDLDNWTVTNILGRRAGIGPEFFRTGIMQADVQVTVGEPTGKRVVIDGSPAIEAYDAANEQTVNIDGAENFMRGTLATDAAGQSRVEIGEGEAFDHPAEEVRLYGGSVHEIDPAQLTTFVSTFGGADFGVTRLSAADWVAGVLIPTLSLFTNGHTGAVSDSAVLSATRVQLNGVALVAVSAPLIDLSGVVDVTEMGGGSVGTGAFRDSVRAEAATGARLFAGTTATAGGTAAKTSTIAGYVPASGDTLALKLTNGNSAASPTLNINGGGAKAIQLGGAAVGVVGGASAAGTIWALRYDGTVWHLAGAQSPHANTVAFAGLSLIADRLPYADGSGTLALTTFTAAARALLDDATAGDMLTTLGLSAFVKTLMDDADASAFLTTLGVTTFVKTLLDDTTAGAFLTTLGISAFAQTLLDDAAATNVLTTLGVSAFIQTLLDDADADTARATLLARSLRKAINTQAGTAYTLVLTDEDKVIELTNNGGAIVVTVPLNATAAFPVGTEIRVDLTGTSTATFTPAVGATINSRGSLLSINGRYGVAYLRKRATNTWVLSGDLA